MTYLLESGSDRIGALDFQLSAGEYKPRSPTNATLDELLEAADHVEKGIPLTPELDQAIHHGSSIGGARPKALIEDRDKKYIAKFSSNSDVYSVVKGEFIAMRLAEIVGLNVAPVTLKKAAHKDVLLIERFDRVVSSQGCARKRNRRQWFEGASGGISSTRRRDTDDCCKPTRCGRRINAGIRFGQRIRGAGRRESKGFLRGALAPRLGQAVFDRAKRGFAVPLDGWFRGSRTSKRRAFLPLRNARTKNALARCR